MLPAVVRADAERIWRAGVAAVTPERLVPTHVRVDGRWLIVEGEPIDLAAVARIAIVGGGKAAGALAVAVEKVLGPQLLDDKRVVGWVNVPADGIVPTERVHLHAARPAGVNEPRAEGAEGTRRILELVSSLGPSDLCICLLTGGGSALMPAPIEGISLEQKIQLTRLMSAAGANIEQLNTVRQQISSVKGGKLASACTAGRLITLAISDVLGDPIEVIASGPTVATEKTADEALAILADLGLAAEPSLRAVIRYFADHRGRSIHRSRSARGTGPPARRYVILGNNAVAVDAAGVEAERLGYWHAMISATRPEGAAEDVGRHLAETALRMRAQAGPDCLISGGEPTVKLVDASQRGKGGRNQQLALSALSVLGDCRNIGLLSAGTDGEDGPTDAAGAFVTEEVIDAARANRLDPQVYLARNDAYDFFQQAGGLLITGPTHTNVCDLRVVLVARGSARPAWGTN